MITFVTIGDTLIFRRKIDNPYREARLSYEGKTDAELQGQERKEGLSLLSQGQLPESYDVWYAPSSGGARRFNEADYALARSWEITV